MKNATWILIFGVFTVWVAVSCSSKEERTEKAFENTIKNTTGENVDIDKKGDEVTIESEGYKAEMNLKAKSWPKEIPSEIPVFKSESVLKTTYSTTPEGEAWMMYYEGITEEDIDQYTAALKKAGFEVVEFKMGKGSSVSGNKGEFVVSCMFSEKNTMISVQKNKQ